MSWPPIVTLPALSAVLRRFGAVRLWPPARGVAARSMTPADGFLAGGAEAAHADVAAPRPSAATMRATVAARLVVWLVVFMGRTVPAGGATGDGPQVWSQ